MTPHRHWLLNFTPMVIPIRLADGKVVYSTGIGTVQFIPKVDGKQFQGVELTRVLHVPALRNNLLSLLYLMQKKDFTVIIKKNHVDFVLGNALLFTAQVNESNITLLNGSTVFSSENANIASLNLSLWHHRLGHLNMDSIRLLISKNMVT